MSNKTSVGCINPSRGALWGSGIPNGSTVGCHSGPTLLASGADHLAASKF